MKVERSVLTTINEDVRLCYVITLKTRVILYRSILLNTNADSIDVTPVNLTLFNVNNHNFPCDVVVTKSEAKSKISK